ncbi:MAG: cellulase family glycosylhydrolase [Deltaproteobacteria bacterium]|nr:cellulase family glycosylhydrolase [Deltaproteobacteria bacterium]
MDRRVLTAIVAGSAIFLGACGDDDGPADVGPTSDASVPEDAPPQDDASERDGAASDAGDTDSGPEIPEVPDAERCSIEAPALATGALRVDGRDLVDELGRRVILRGVNAGGRSKFPPFAPFELASDADFEPQLTRFMDIVAAWGIDVLRMPFSWEALEPERGAYDEAYLARYERQIEEAWARGMRVVVDFHQDVYARPLCGDGFPLWSLAEIPDEPPVDCASWFLGYLMDGGPVQLAFERFWANEDGLFDAFVAMWTTMVERVGDQPGIAGYEIINEPGWGTGGQAELETTILPAAIERVAAAIREVQPDAIVFAGGPGTNAIAGDTMMRRPDIEQLVYAPHYYEPSLLVGGSYRSVTPVRRAIDRLSSRGVEWDTPVLYGEFGASNESPDQRRYLRDVYALFDEHLVHATLWETSLASADWNEEALGTLNADGSERAVVDDLVRGYVRAVDGQVDRMTWVAEDATFVLEVSGAGPQVAEVYVPPRHAGDAPRIGLDAGCVDWDAERGLLLVQPSGDRWTLVVEP